ncbi:MAG: hypothetical protein LBQ33_06185 [Oscillospiraceae bacterium]|jgi:hypothetical protein|nr:hypothetical protein [Oscillospiraceae bacterium]
MTAQTCRRCGAALSADERALTKKLINRGAQEFFCLPCLALHFSVTPERLRELTAQYRRQGCMLFESS